MKQSRVFNKGVFFQTEVILSLIRLGDKGVHFRRYSIQPLASSPPAPRPAEEMARGFVSGAQRSHARELDEPRARGAKIRAL